MSSSSSKDRERDRAPEPHNKSMAQEVLNEWWAWRERMRQQDQSYQEEFVRRQHEERHAKQRATERAAAPDHIPTEDEMALHAPSTFHDQSDELAEMGHGAHGIRRENKTHQDRMTNAGGVYRAGRDRNGRRVGDKPASTNRREVGLMRNDASGKIYEAQGPSDTRTTTGKRIYTPTDAFL